MTEELQGVEKWTCGRVVLASGKEISLSEERPAYRYERDGKAYLEVSESKEKALAGIKRQMEHGRTEV